MNVHGDTYLSKFRTSFRPIEDPFVIMSNRLFTTFFGGNSSIAIAPKPGSHMHYGNFHVMVLLDVTKVIFRSTFDEI